MPFVNNKPQFYRIRRPPSFFEVYLFQYRILFISIFCLFLGFLLGYLWRLQQEASRYHLSQTLKLDTIYVYTNEHKDIVINKEKIGNSISLIDSGINNSSFGSDNQKARIIDFKNWAENTSIGGTEQSTATRSKGFVIGKSNDYCMQYLDSIERYEKEVSNRINMFNHNLKLNNFEIPQINTHIYNPLSIDEVISSIGKTSCDTIRANKILFYLNQIKQKFWANGLPKENFTLDIHYVREGESIEGIAKQYNISISNIKNAN